MNPRIEKIWSFLAEKDIEALVVTEGNNVKYVSGTELEDATLLLIAGKNNLVITDQRFVEEAEAVKEFQAEIVSEKLPEALAEKFRILNLKKVAFEANALTYNQYLLLKETCDGVEFIATHNLIEQMRAVKDDEEVIRIKKCIEIASLAFEALLSELRPGASEKMIANRLDFLLREKGAERAAFEVIAAAGSLASRPHSRPTQHLWQIEESLMLDWGVYCDGYNCDLTRMVFSDRITADQKRIYKILLEAQEKAIACIKPGIKAKEVDEVARNFLKTNGLGEFFLHSLGHGIGREVHEAPWISEKSETTLEKNMVFTIEPAVYFQGAGGMRIEDMVLVTNQEVEILSAKVRRLLYD
jgi:Xaa-Pro aminopeptidase